MPVLLHRCVRLNAVCCGGASGCRFPSDFVTCSESRWHGCRFVAQYGLFGMPVRPVLAAGMGRFALCCRFCGVITCASACCACSLRPCPRCEKCLVPGRALPWGCVGLPAPGWLAARVARWPTEVGAGMQKAPAGCSAGASLLLCHCRRMAACQLSCSGTAK